MTKEEIKEAQKYLKQAENALHAMQSISNEYLKKEDAGRSFPEIGYVPADAEHLAKLNKKYDKAVRESAEAVDKLQKLLK